MTERAYNKIAQPNAPLDDLVVDLAMLVGIPLAGIMIFLGALLLAASFAQVGALVAWEAIKPDWKKLNPIKKAQQMGNLASALNRQEKYGEAEKWLKQAMSIVADTPGADESQLVSLYGNLADTQYHLGNLKDSEKNYTKALELALKHAGPESSFVASDKAGLALIYVKQGRYKEAKVFFEDALIVFERLGGKDHPVFKKTMKEYQALLSKIKTR